MACHGVFCGCQVALLALQRRPHELLLMAAASGSRIHMAGAMQCSYNMPGRCKPCIATLNQRPHMRAHMHVQ